MTIPRNLSILAEYAGTVNAPVLNLTNTGEVTTVSATAATGTINYDVLTQSVLYYMSNATGNWRVWDTGRGVGTSTDPRLALNSTAAELNNDWVL